MGAQAVRLSNIDIDNALANKDFEVQFQPIFDLGNGALARMETFVRWRHASLGVLPPGAFISFFESQGRMSELTRYVLNCALSEYLDWRGASAPGFSINLALSDLADEAFASHFRVVLRDRGFSPDLVTLECPMPPVTMDAAQAAAHFHRLSDTGARLAIEVRGRANDFLRTIDPFPFDEIKTGGAAILRFARTVRGPGLSAISELLEIANRANAAITAVGVEDQASLSALRSLGFAAAQGNHLGKVGELSSFTTGRVNEVRALLGLEPLSADELAALFRTEVPTPVPQAQRAIPDREPTLAAPTPVDDAAQDPALPAMPDPQSDEALIERLTARIAEKVSAPEDRLAAAKEAAIAQARRKAVAARHEDSGEPAADAAQAPESMPEEADAAPARSLQEWLSREFDAADEPHGAAPAPTQDNSCDAASSVSHKEARSRVVSAPDKSPSDKATPAAAETGAAALPDFNAVSLNVEGARAVLRPGLRIAVMRPVNPVPAENSDLIEYIDDDRAFSGETAAPSAEPADAREAETLPTVVTPERAPRRRRTRGRNFLTRRYRITHFWPKSWKRAWLRRAEAAKARRLEREAEREAERETEGMGASSSGA